MNLFKRKQKGFTLIELLVVVSVIGLLTSIALVSLNSARAKGRDARRKLDMEQIIKALALYYNANNVYPPNNPPAQGVGGWNVSYLDGFLASLVPQYMASSPKDPINQLETGFTFFGPKAGSYFYAYYNYPVSSTATYGCSFTGDFSVIAIRQLETGMTADTPRAMCGVIPPGGCPEGGIPSVCRDWSTEFDYSVILIK